MSPEESVQVDAPSPNPLPAPIPGAVPDVAADRRRPSLDAARGLVLVIAFVWTTPSWDRAMEALPASGVKRFFEEQATHAEWHGFHIIDWGFPAFIIYLAASMALSRGRRQQQGETKGQFVGRVLLRGLLLWIYAFFLYGGFAVPFTEIDFAHVFFLLSACVVLSGLSLAFLNWRGHLLALVLVLLGNWAFMALFPVPGYGAGDFSREGNALQYVENLLTVATRRTGGESAGLLHLRQDLVRLSGLAVGAYGTCLIGLLVGRILISKYSVKRQVIILTICGVAALDAGWLMSAWLPINKRLWDASFTLFSGGLTFVTFAGIVQVIEVWRFRRLAHVFAVFGRYPLAAWTVYFLLPWENFAQRLFGPSFPPIFGAHQPLVIDISQVVLCWLVFAWWDARREEIERAKRRLRAMATSETAVTG
jgi:predicted acyltransferase